MPTLRIEPRQDAATGLYFIEVYLPADAASPFVTTAPRYVTAAAAEGDLIATITAVASRARAG